MLIAQEVCQIATVLQLGLLQRVDAGLVVVI